MSWPQWHRDNPAGLLTFVQPGKDYWGSVLSGLPTRAQGHGGNRLDG